LIVGASVFIHKDGKLLLQKRRDNGCWAEHGGWFAMLLSFGDKVTVLSPEELKTRITETAENILSLYKKQ